MTNDKPLIQLSVSTWTEDQKFAIGRACAESLTHTAAIFGDAWSNTWWESVLKYLKLSQDDLESRTQPLPDVIQTLSQPKDIRIEVLMDLLALSLETVDKKIMIYDARARRFLLQLQYTLDLYRGDLACVERSVSQQMYYALVENKPEEARTAQEKMDLYAKQSMQDASQKKQIFKWMATGASVIGGGALIGKKKSF